MTGNELRRELKKIGDRNRRFNKMTPKKQRVTIAKDVLAALKAKKILASAGQYLGYNYRSNGNKLPDNYECSVCALGGMFVGLTTRIKDLSVKQPESTFTSMHYVLRPYFNVIQLYMIETAFEYKRRMWQLALGDEVYSKCINFGVQYYDDNSRLIAIMNNIIANNGEFRP